MARANGEGSIYQRKDGRWVGEIEVGRLENGRPDRRYVYRKTERDARLALAEIVRQHDRGGLVARDREKETLADFAAAWLESHQVRPNTKKRYEQLLRLQIVPGLGRHRLGALRPAQIRAWLATLPEQQTARGPGRRAGATRPLSPRSIHHAYVLLHTILEAAVAEEYLSRNPCDPVAAPAVEDPQTYTPKPAELDRLLAATESDALYPLWQLAVKTGARVGELLGLQWADIDCDARTLHIRRTLLQSTKGMVPQYGEPKTDRSRRLIPLAKRVVEVLRAHRERQEAQRQRVGESWANHDLVFCTHTGAPYLHSNIHRSFKAALRKAGLPETMRIHDLRHGAATLFLAAGVQLKTASELLGHSSVAITADIYQDRVAALEAAAVERLDQTLAR